MNILVACEESQRVCKAFRDKGHTAFSCDVIEPSGGHPEWHIQQDVLPLLNGNCSFTTLDGVEHQQVGKWDMIIAFPPCTDLAVSGARWFEHKRKNGSQEKSIEFFCQFLKADCERVVIENPVNIISGKYIKKWFPQLCDKYGLPVKPTQIIHPWQYGENEEKTTQLWIKGVKPLVPYVEEQPKLEYFEWIDKKTGNLKRQPLWWYEALKQGKDRAKIRSKTFLGIALAMAEQWGSDTDAGDKSKSI